MIDHFCKKILLLKSLALALVIFPRASEAVSSRMVTASSTALRRLVCRDTSFLGKWREEKDEVSIRFCVSDSVDEQHVTIYSKLDVWQETKGDSTVVNWKIHDEIGRGLINIKLYPPSFSVIDVDGDGKMESFFGYIFRGEGADPIAIKFIGHMRGKKYAVRGRIPWVETDERLFEMNYDGAFSFADPKFRSATDSLLKQFIVKSQAVGELGDFLPYQMGGVKSLDE